MRQAASEGSIQGLLYGGLLLYLPAALYFTGQSLPALSYLAGGLLWGVLIWRFHSSETDMWLAAGELGGLAPAGTAFLLRRFAASPGNSDNEAEMAVFFVVLGLWLAAAFFCLAGPPALLTRFGLAWLKDADALRRCRSAAWTPGLATAIAVLAVIFRVTGYHCGPDWLDFSARLTLGAGLTGVCIAFWTVVLAYASSLGSLPAALKEVGLMPLRLLREGWRRSWVRGALPAAAALPALSHSFGRAGKNEEAGPRGPAPEAGTEVLVDAGSFRVDRAKALEKLAGFQLADPEAFLLCWIRCAVASGAGRIRLERRGPGLRMSFDGEGLTGAALEDPYECLLSDDGRRSVPGRHLAMGLLAALSLRPAGIRLTSGKGEARSCLVVGSPGGSSAEPEPGEETVLEVRWEGLLGVPRRERCLALARSGFGPCRAGLFIDGAAVEAWPAEGDRAERGKDGREGFVASRRAAGLRPGIRLYHLGALVEELPWPGAPLPLEACIEDKAFTLNLSQSGVLRGANFDRAVAAACRMADALGGAAAGGVGSRTGFSGLTRHLLFLAVSGAAAYKLWNFFPSLPPGMRELWTDPAEIFVSWWGACFLLCALTGSQLLVAAFQGRWIDFDRTSLKGWKDVLLFLPLMALAGWMLAAIGTLPIFHGLAVGEGWARLQYPWPLARRVALADIKAVRVIQGMTHPVPVLTLELQDRRGRVFVSASLRDRNLAAHTAQALSAASGAPLEWWKSDGFVRLPAPELGFR